MKNMRDSRSYIISQNLDNKERNEVHLEKMEESIVQKRTDKRNKKISSLRGRSNLK